jgi:uncharacterized protein (DUF1697 family)
MLQTHRDLNFMPRYVAFLRGINLGKRRIAMSVLKSIFEEMGFEDVATFIASGNVLFSSKATAVKKMESQIEAQLKESLGYEVDTFIRTAKEVLDVGNADIFAETGNPGITVHVGFFKDKISDDAAKVLHAVRTPDDEFRVDGRQLYWLCRIRTSDSVVWKDPQFKTLKLPTLTMRNMTSVRKLIAQHLL